MSRRTKKTGLKDGGGLVIRHDMRVEENFERCAGRLFKMAQDAAKQFPGRRRILIIDIQGHRNDAGGFDRDAFEIINHFLFTYLMPFLTEAVTP